MRSTSHFWSKLYELSTPSHLLYGSTGGSQGGSGFSHQVSTNAGPSTANSGTATPSSEHTNPAHSLHHTAHAAHTTAGNTHYSSAHDFSPGTSPSKYRGGNGGGAGYEYSPDNSPFGSRAGTPVGSPTPSSKILNMYSNNNSSSGIAATGNTNNASSASASASADAIQASSAPPTGTALRKMISRHSSRSLMMSRSQLERGKLLELCLAVLGCSAQWHLQLLANRCVFSVSRCMYDQIFSLNHLWLFIEHVVVKFCKWLLILFITAHSYMIYLFFVTH